MLLHCIRGVEELGAGGILESPAVLSTAGATDPPNFQNGDLPSFLTDPEFHLSTVRALQEKSRYPVQIKYGTKTKCY